MTTHVQYCEFQETSSLLNQSIISFENEFKFAQEIQFSEKTLCCVRFSALTTQHAFTVGNLTCDRPAFHCSMATHKVFIFYFVFIIALYLLYTVSFHFPLLPKLFFYSASVVEIAQNRKRRFLRLE